MALYVKVIRKSLNYNFDHNLLPENYDLNLYDRGPEINGPEFKGNEPVCLWDYPEKKKPENPKDLDIESYDRDGKYN